MEEELVSQKEEEEQKLNLMLAQKLHEEEEI